MPLIYALLLQHCHRLLLSHLPGLDLSINRAARTRITETVGEVVVELRETWLENKQVRDKKDNKGATEYFGANLAHLLNLVQETNGNSWLCRGPSTRQWRTWVCAPRKLRHPPCCSWCSRSGSGWRAGTT